MQPFLYVIVFVAVFLAAEGLLLLFGGQSAARRSQAAKRLRRMASRLRAPDPSSEGTLLRESKERASLLDSLYDLVPGREAIELRLYRAGILWTPSRFAALSGALGLAGFGVGFVFWKDPLVGLLFSLVGFLPWIQAGRRASKRMRRFEEQFPEALELMTRALRAGHSLTLAFQLVGEELPEPINREFAHVSEEIKLGQELRVALANLAYRAGAGDLPYFTTAVMVQRETGGNLAELLDNLGYIIRDRFKLFGKVRSLTAVGKATANILGVWPILMVAMLHVVGADFVSLLWTERSGHILALVASLLVVVGWVLCRKAAEIRV